MFNILYEINKYYKCRLATLQRELQKKKRKIDDKRCKHETKTADLHYSVLKALFAN